MRRPPVSLDRLNARGELDVGCIAANESEDSRALPGEPLHDLRSNGAGAACDENVHRPAPCCNSRRWRMMWGADAVWKWRRPATERRRYATPMDPNAPCRMAGFELPHDQRLPVPGRLSKIAGVHLWKICVGGRQTGSIGNINALPRHGARAL